MNRINMYRINELPFIEKCNPSKTRLWFPGNGLRINLFLSLILASVNVFASDAPESESTPSESQAQTGTKTDKYKISMDVNLVTTEVRVIGQPISELQAEDFIIYDNGVPQEIAFISHDQLPISFALIYIESDKIYRYPNLKVATYLALKNLKPEDEVALFSYGGSYIKDGGGVNKPFSQQADFTGDRLSIADKISRLSGYPVVNINSNDVIIRTAKYLRENARNRRRAIILFSYDYSLGNEDEIEKARSELLRSGASIFNIQAPRWRQVRQLYRIPEQMPDELAISKEKLKETVEISGGAVFRMKALDSWKAASFQEALFEAIDYFRYQYTLGFYPSDPGDPESFHNLEVKIRTDTRCPGCRIVARTGYYPYKPPLIDPTAKTPSIVSPDSEKSADLLVQQSIFTAGSTLFDFPEVPFTLETSEQESADGRQIKVEMKIDYESVEFKRMENTRVCDLQAAVFYWDKKGNILGRDWKRLEGAVGEDGYYKRDSNKGVHYSTLIPMKDKHQMVKAVVYDEGRERIGSKISIPFIIEKIKRKEVNGQPHLKVKLKVYPHGIFLEEADDARLAYKLKIAATDSDREDDIPADYWKGIEGSFLEENLLGKLDSWLDIEAVLPDFTKGEVVRIIVQEESSGKTSSRLIRLSE